MCWLWCVFVLSVISFFDLQCGANEVNVFVNVTEITCMNFNFQNIARNTIRIQKNGTAVLISIFHNNTDDTVIEFGNYSDRIISYEINRQKDTLNFCLINTTKEDAGIYNEMQSETRTRVTVLDKPTKARIIVKDTGEVGKSNGILTCISTSTSTPTGLQITYSWRVNSTIISSNEKYEIKEQGNQNLQIVVARSEMVNEYICSGHEQYGQKSKWSLASFVDPKRPPRVKIEPDMERYALFENDSLSIECEVVDANPTTYNYSWIKDDTILNGQTSNILRIVKSKRTDSGEYKCSVTNGIGNAAVEKILIDVLYAPDALPVIKQTPQGPINSDNKVALTCLVSGGNPLAILSWNCSGNTTNNTFGNTASSSINFTVNRTTNNRICTCSGNHNVTSYRPNVNHRLVVYYGPTRIDISPTTTSYTVTEADNLDKITCSADCNPNCTMTWNGPHIPQGTTSALNLQSIDRSHAGTYYCTASNTIGSQVTVTVKVVVYYGSRIVDISPDTTSYAVTENTGIAQIICSADCKPNCTMTWTGPNLPQSSTSALNLNNIDRNQAGSYHCTARNNIGSRKSITIQIIVNYAPDTTPAVQQTPKGVIVPGNKVKLTCTLSGGHPLAVLSWDCNGTYTNNTSRNTASYSVEFTADTTYNNKICNCSATHLFTSYRRSVKHALEVYCSPQYIQIQDERGLFTAGISSLIIGLLSLILTIVLIACWRVRITKTSKSPDHYTEFTPKSSTETVAYDVINQTTNIDTNRSATEDIDRGVYNYEECQPYRNTDHSSDDVRQEPKGSKMMTGEEYDYVKV